METVPLIRVYYNACYPLFVSRTPLHCAASCNNLPMVRFLVEHGACIFATTISDNETAAEKCEEDEDGYDGCSDYLYSELILKASDLSFRLLLCLGSHEQLVNTKNKWRNIQNVIFFSLQRKISFNDLDIHVWNPQMKDTPVCSFIRTTFSENLGFLTEQGGGQPILSPWCFQLFFYSLLRQPLPPLMSEYLKNSQQNLFMIGVSVLKG